MLDWSLISGPAPVVVLAAGGVALVFLLLSGHDRSWWSRTVPLVALATATALGAGWVVVAALGVFPDPLPAVVWCSVAAVLLALGLMIVAVPRSTRGRRIVGPVAVVLVLIAAGNQVNSYFGQYPTARAVFGLPPLQQVDFAQLAPQRPILVTAPPGQPLSLTWRAPPGMPTAGVVSQVAIPATVSGFPARPAWVYLPPAYLAVPRAALPVLVLLAGQPGNPRDWLDGGQLAPMMDRFAAAHHGLAPVVVMPDPLGSALANPLCLDSRLGHAATYLTIDVPTWIRTHLQINPDPRAWAVAGLSEGGTCALQLAVNSPQTYPSFVDISGHAQPTLGTPERTVATAFGGDIAAYTAVNPLDVLATHRLPDSAATIVVGRADTTYRTQAQQVAAACRRAGMQIQYRELPGGHDWHVWAPGLDTSLPWLATRWHLTP